MKNPILSLFISLFIFGNCLQAQTEILIVGTSHDVATGMENNYAPILELTKNWQADIICSEYRKPNDTLSLQSVFGKNYLLKMDSVALAWNIPMKNIDAEIKKLFAQLSQKEAIYQRMQLRNLLYLKMDRGNARFQIYLIDKAFSQLSESEKKNFNNAFPMFESAQKKLKKYQRDEYVLAAFPLAEQSNIDYLYPTDDQSLNQVYSAAWGKSVEELKDTPQFKSFKKLLDQLKIISKKAMANGDATLLFNSHEAQELLYKIEFSYFEPGLSAQSDLMSFYWGERNLKMANHILEVAANHPNKKIVAFYGSSHVPAIRRALRAISDHKILTLADLDTWKKHDTKLKSNYIVDLITIQK